MISKKEYLSSKDSAIHSKTTSQLKISWILHSDAIGKCLLLAEKDQINEKQPLLGLCSAPGKKLAKGRDGKSHDRSINDDMKDFKQRGVSCIVCLLNKYELRTLGIDLDIYTKACVKEGIDLILYPIIEMASPEVALEIFDSELIEKISSKIEKGNCVVIHCRGGIGRAGLVASCVLLKNRIVKSAIQAIKSVRLLRDPRAVESRKQEDFIKQYAELTLLKHSI